MTNPSFAIINTEEIQKLSQHNCSASVFQVYFTLCAFAQNKSSCFPSLQTIKTYLGSGIAINTISRAITKLEKLEIIKRGAKRSKERFFMRYRKAVQQAKGVFNHFVEKGKEVLYEVVDRRKPIRKDNLYTKKYKKKSYISKKEQARREAQRAKQQEQLKKREQSPEYALERLLAGVISVKELTNKQSKVLHDASSQRTLNIDYEWLDEYHPNQLLLIKDELRRKL